jgi:hypothetical protein
MTLSIQVLTLDRYKDKVIIHFTLNCLLKGSCLICAICDCLRMVVSFAYCAMFGLSSSCVSYVAILNIFNCLFGIF